MLAEWARTWAGPWSLTGTHPALPTSLLGDEIDLTLVHPISSGLTATGGYSWVRVGDAMGPVRGISTNVSFGYLMLDLRF